MIRKAQRPRNAMAARARSRNAVEADPACLAPSAGTQWAHQVYEPRGLFMSEVMEVSPLESGRAAAARHSWHEAHDLLQEADAAGELTPDDLRALGEAAWWLGRLEESI